MSTRDALRGATVGSPSKFKKKLVKYGEFEFEVRELSPADREAVRRASQGQVLTHKDGSQELVLDQAKYTAHLIVRSVFVPGTEEKVFDNGDIAAIIGSPTGGYYKALGDAAAELMQEAVAEGNE